MKRRLLIVLLLAITIFALFSCAPKQQKGGAEGLARDITFTDSTVVYTGDEFEVAFKGTLVDLSTYYYSYNGKDQETPFKFKNVGSYTVKLTIENPNFYTYEKSIIFTIKQATPEITTLPVASQIKYGQLLSDSALTGGVSNVKGTFAWARPDTKPNVATARDEGYEVLFTPDDKLNYETVSMQITFVVEKVIPTIELVFPTVPDTTLYGAKFGDIIFNNDGTVAEYGSFIWKDPEVVPTVGDIPTTIVFVPSENYDFSHGYVLSKDVVVKINPAVLTVAAVAQTYTYGDAMTFNEATYTGRYYEITGFVNGETIAVVKTLPTFETAVTDAGRYANHIVYSGAVADNYTFYYRPATLIIEKFTPTVTVLPTASGVTYGQPLNESELSGGTAHGVDSDIPGTFVWTQGATLPTVADSGVTGFEVNFVPNDNNNYNYGTCEVTLAVARATLTDTTQDYVSVYNAQAQYLTVSATGVAGETIANNRISGLTVVYGTNTSYSSGTNNVGIVNVKDSKTIYYKITSDNYEDLEGSALVTINKANAVVSADLKYSRIHEDLVALSTSTSGFRGDDMPIVVNLVTNANKDAVGLYDITYEVTNVAELSENYNLTVSQGIGAYEVRPPLPPVEPKFPTASDLTYGQTLSQSELTGGEGDGEYAWSNPAAKPGVHQREASVTFTINDDVNYDYRDYVGYDGETHTIVRLVPITVHPADFEGISFDAKTESYNGFNKSIPLIITQPLPIGTTVTYMYDGQESPTPYVFMNAGIYNVGVRVTNDNYNTFEKFVDLTINPISARVMADDKSSAYGDDLLELTYTVEGVIGSDAEKVVVTLSSTADKTIIEATPIIVETVTDMEGEDVCRNYVFTIINGTYTVTKAIPTEVVFPTYIRVTHNDYLRNAELEGYSGDGVWSWANPDKVCKTTGQETLIFTPNDTEHYDYTIYEDFNAQAGAIVRTVTVIVTDAPMNLTYDDCTREYDGTHYTHNVVGEVPEGATVVYTLTTADRTDTSSNTYNFNMINVGTYVIHVIAECENYLTFEDEVTVTITPITLETGWTIIGSDEPYDDENPFVYNGYVQGIIPVISNKIAGDDVEITTTNNTKTNAGSYTATITSELTGASAGNYKFSDEQEMTKAWRIIKATPQEVIYPIAYNEITYGEPLSHIELVNGSGDGYFFWKYPTYIPNVGENGRVVFIPNDVDNYDYTGVAFEFDVAIVVNKVVLTDADIVYPTASPITYESKLSNIPLNYTTNAYGRFAWSDPDFVPPASTRSAMMAFIPNDVRNYDYTSVTMQREIQITVNKKFLNIAAPTLAESSFVYGTKLKDVEFEEEAFEYGKYEWLHPTIKPNVADETAEVMFTLRDSDNYYIDELDPAQTVKLFVIPITVDPAEFIIPNNDRESMYDGLWKSLIYNWMPDDTSFSTYVEETGDSSPDAAISYRNAGVYTYHITMTNVNYVTTEYTAVLTISQRPATLTVNYIKSPIGEPLAELTYVWDAYNLDEIGRGIEIELYMTDLDGNVVEREDIDTSQSGTYYIKATVSGARLDNYDVTIIDAMYLIIEPELSAVTFTGVSTTYDGEEYMPEWTNLDGLTLAPDATIKLIYSDYEDEEFYYYSDGEWHYDQLFSFSNAGKHIVTAELNSSNYNGGATVYYQAVVLIERREVIYEWRPRDNQSGPEYTDDNPLIYNGKAQSIIPVVLNKIEGDEVYFGLHDYRHHVDCGFYTATVWNELQGESRDNYFYQGGVSRKYEIAPATLTYTANDKTIIYGDAPSNAGYTLTGLQVRDGDVEEESLVVRGRTSYSYTYTQYGDIGEYAIQIDVSTLHADNYIFESVDGVLTVNPKVLNIIWNTTNDINGTRYGVAYTYSGTVHGVYPFITNLFHGDEVYLTVDDNEAINVGTYTATLSDVLMGANAGNYVLPEVTSCDFVIEKTLLTIRAVNNTITYGDPVTNAGYTITGFVNGETDDVIYGKESIALNYNYAQWDDVRDGIFVIYVDISGISADNYDFFVINGTLTVNKYELDSVLWYTDTTYETLYTAAYDYTAYPQGIYPQLGAAVLNGDEVYLTTSNNVKVNAGTYTTEEVRLAGAQSGNYKISDYVILTKQFGINKASVTVTPRDNVITYGQPASHNGYEVTGFLGADGRGIIDGMPNYSYSYDQFDDVGEYEITIDVTPLSSTNYTFVVGGTAVLTVNRKPVQIAWNVLGTDNRYTQAFTYNGESQGVYAVVGNKVNDDDVVLESENNTAANVGNYVANAVQYSLSGTKAYNYIWNDEQELEMTFAIEKAVLSVKANDNAITYGEAPTDAGYVITGFMGTDTIDNVVIENIDSIDYTYGYAQYGNVGIYSITPNVTALLSDNYTFKAVKGDLTVNKREIEFVWYTANDLEADEYTEPFLFNGAAQGVYPFITNVVAGATGVLDNVYLNVSANTAVNVGTYTTSNVTIGGTKGMNYKLPESALNKVFVINPKPVDIIWCIDDFTYDTTNQFGKVNAHYIDVNGIEVALALSVADDDFTEVEEEGYYIFSAAFKNGETNYVLIAPLTKEYHMQPYTLDVYWSDVKSNEYNGYDQSDAVQAWYILNDEINYLVTSCNRVYKDYNNGTPYRFTADFETPLKNYRLNEDMRTDNFYISPALIKVTVNPSTITYGEEVYASDAYYIDESQLKGEDTLAVVTGSPTFYSDDYEQYGDVGTYTITVDVSGFRALNYYFEPDTPARLKVNPLQAVIAWRLADGTIFNRGDTIEYSGEEQGIYPFVSNAVNDDDVSYVVRNNLRKPLGNYSASVTGLSGTKARNYVMGTSRTMPFEIVQRTVEIVWFTSNEYTDVYTEPFVYNGTFQGVYPKIVNAVEGEDVMLYVSGNTARNVSLSGLPYRTDDVILSGADVGNYRLPADGINKEFEIIKATLSVNANDASNTFGEIGATAGINFSGFMGEDTEDTVIINGIGGVIVTAIYERYQDCGEYAIVVDENSIEGLSAQNYAFVKGDDGVLTVNKATLTDITTDYVGVYDGQYHTITFAVTGFVHGEDVSCATVVYGISDEYESGYDPVTCKTVADGKAVYYKATFTNYNDVIGVKNVTIERAELIDRTQEVSVIYDGLTYTIIVTCDGVNGESISNVSIDGLLIEYGTDTTYSSGSTNIGAINVVDSTTVYYRITSDNYATLTGYKDIEIRPATPVIVELPVASDIVYGQRLVDSVLSGGVAQYELATGLTEVPGTFSWKDPTTVPVVIESNTKEFDVIFMPTDTSNYNAVECKVMLTIIKATPTVTVNPMASAITYGQTLSVSTLTGGEASTEGTFVWSDLAIKPLYRDSEVTEYEVTFIPDDGANYNRTTTTVTLVVNRRLIRITSSSVNKVYDGTALTSPSCSITSGTLAQGDAVLNLNVATGTITDVGSTPNAMGEIRIVKGAVDMTENYIINTVEGTLRVTPAAIGYTVSGYDDIYDGAAHTISLTDITTVNAQQYTVRYGTSEGVYDLDVAPTYANVGTYVVYFEITAPNHRAVQDSATVTIAKATPIITADPTASAINYGQTLNASSLTGGEVEYDLASGTATVAGRFAWSTPGVRPVVADSGVTEYEVTFTPDDTVNYVSVTTRLTIVVNKLTLTVRAPSVVRVYNGTELTAHTCTYTGTLAQGDAIESLNVAIGGITDVGSAVNAVGAVRIVRGAVDMTENYIINKVDGTLTVTSATITYTASGYDDIYDGTAHTISLTDITTVNAQEYTVRYGTSEGVYDLDVAPTYANVGTYVVYFEITAPNHTAVTGSETVTISKATLTVTANDNSVTYGDAPSNNGYTVTGFEGADDDGVISGTVTYTYAYEQFDNVGTYAIIPNVSGLSADNYDFEAVNGTLTVNAKSITVTADNKTSVYGDPIVALTATLSTALVGSDVNADVFALSTTATSASDADVYVITVTPADNANYDVTAVNGTYTITKATLTVTANDEEITYGDSIPMYVTQITGFVNGDDESVLTGGFEIICAYSMNDSMGVYAITPAIGTVAADNYEFDFVSGNLTVKKKTLTVTADNKVVTYGDAAPAYTATFSGFVAGDDENVLYGAPEFNCEYSQGDDVGSYTITASLGTLTATNYDFGFTNGTLTVNAKAITVTADNKSSTYGDSIVALTATLSTALVGSDVNADVFTLSTTATSASDVDTYVITVTPADNANYDVTAVNGTYTIDKATLTVTADDKAITYGDAAPAYTATITGFVNGDTQSVISGVPALACAYVQGDPDGEYEITVAIGTLDADNYEFDFVSGALTVTPAE